MSERLPTVGLVSLGCSKNTVDSEVLLARLDAAGFGLTRSAEEAQVLVVNTCGFIDAAKQESIETILEMAGYKDGGSCERLLVVGCLSQRYQRELQESLPEVDAFFGTEQQSAVVDHLLAAYGATTRRPSAALGGPREDVPPRLLTSEGPSAYLKISEGCNHTCSFCVIPDIRGKHRSRPLESLVAEAQDLARRGARELAIIAQDPAYYGLDLSMRAGLETLLGRLEAVEGLEWIRLHYIYPGSVRDGLVERLASLEKMVPYLDMPVQHGADAVLRRMRRPDTRKSLETLVERLRSAVPDISLRTTVIVGFPGETDADFDELLDFVDTCQFDHLGVFTYSDEEDSRAFALDGKVDPALASERQERLVALQQEISRERLSRFAGRPMRVLVEGRTAEGLLVGRTAHQAREVDGVTYVRASAAPADGFVTARIERTLDYDLVGAAIGPLEPGSGCSASPAGAPVLIPLGQLSGPGPWR
jgi:ribosomal protein S12 methylthiotransferase